MDGQIPHWCLSEEVCWECHQVGQWNWGLWLQWLWVDNEDCRTYAMYYMFPFFLLGTRGYQVSRLRRFSASRRYWAGAYGEDRGVLEVGTVRLLVRRWPTSGRCEWACDVASEKRRQWVLFTLIWSLWTFV